MQTKHLAIFIRSLTLLLVATTLGACSTNPATGKRQLSFIGEEKEIAIGRETDQQIIAQMGLYPDEELQEYVNALGQKLAAQSERPDLPWTFRVVDDPVVNAFALPGGFIYVTRGILTHFNSEAELAGVLGHEIGHVTGRHGVEQMSKAQLAQIGLGVGMIASPELRQFGDLANTGMSVLLLKFGRDAEREADDLGLRYVNRTAYNPHEMVDVFEMLQRVSSAQGDGSRLPGWLSTHPTPENRISRLNKEIDQTPGAYDNTTVNRDRFMAQIENVVYGDDPRQGFFVDEMFYHPELAFSLRFPDGWKTINQRQVVAAVSPNQDAVVMLSLADSTSAENAARDFFAQSQQIRPGRVNRNNLSGLNAVTTPFEVDRGAQAPDIAGLASFVELGTNVYQLLGYTVENRVSTYDRPIESAIGSFRRVTDPRVLNVKPKRLDVVNLPQAMSLRQFDDRYPSSVSLDDLLLLNEVESADAEMPAGFPVKRVRGGELPSGLGR